MAFDGTRGKIVRRKRAQQINDFSGLQYERGITPTDVDLAMEFGGEYWVFGEIKYGDKELPRGQQIFLDRLLRLVPNGRALGLVLRHDVSDTRRDVPVHEVRVAKVWYRGEWEPPARPMTAREAVDWMRENRWGFAPPALPPAPAAGPQMAPGCPYSYDALRNAGWTDQQMRGAGYLV